ncbi:MAG TPA: hypothetical protein VGC13_30725 [Longimicrobium sp.]|jgi:hypothetical protein|uniref:hypothetical protein n=1 Tax=Longimicrobium sp. TaxID=2029185 RepID=UPI002ED889A5
MRASARLIAAAVLAAALPACVNNRPYHLQPGEIAAYDCAGYQFTVQASLSRARLTLANGRIYSLMSDGPGRGYVGEGVRLFVSQRAARLETQSAVYSRCRRV